MPASGYMHVLDACEAINGHVRGSGDGMTEERLAELVDELAQRVGRYWVPSRCRAWAGYDEAVRVLGEQAVQLGRDYLSGRNHQPTTRTGG